jgi:CRP/FNR family cyclic AMP-dependent transcriptional regulator
MDTTRITPVGLLAALAPDELQAFLDCAERVPFRSGQTLLRQGDHNASLFVVQDGLLHVRRHAKEHEVLLGRLETGGVFGEVSLFDPGPTTASVLAVSDGTVIEIRREHLDRFLATHPAAAAKILIGILAEMAKRLRRVDERLVDSILWGGLLK